MGKLTGLFFYLPEGYRPALFSERNQIVMKKFAVVLLASVALASCAYAPGALAATECAGTQTECLNAWFDARFAEELAFSPMRQTQLGMKTDYDKFDDMSVEAAKRQIDWW